MHLMQQQQSSKLPPISSAKSRTSERQMGVNRTGQNQMGISSYSVASQKSKVGGIPKPPRGGQQNFGGNQ